VLHEFVLCADWSGDQYCMGGTDRLNHRAKKVLIFGAVPAELAL